jgi:hypothetical protein
VSVPRDGERVEYLKNVYPFRFSPVEKVIAPANGRTVYSGILRGKEQEEREIHVPKFCVKYIVKLRGFVYVPARARKRSYCGTVFNQH